MKMTLAAALALAAGCFALPAAAQGFGQMQGLMQADANGDGAISRAEAQAARAAMFDRLDANHDGVLSSDEINAGSGAEGGGRMMSMMLSRADSNGDGRVSREEFLSRPQRLFDRFDANHDDVLEPSELAAMRSALSQFAAQAQGN